MRPTHRHLALRALLSISALAAALVAPSATFAATPAATTATAAITTTACDERGWPARTAGQPFGLRAGARGGDYLWHDTNGWHVRFTHAGTSRVIFTGTIVSNAPLSVAGYRMGYGDRFSLSADKRTLTYRFANHGRIDGLDFRGACASRLWIRGSMAGLRLPTWRIWIGRNGTHPLSDPFVIRR